MESKDYINKILQGNVLDVLKKLPDEIVDCVVTSPPYWGLRDYGTGKWEGGDENCDHLEVNDTRTDVVQRSNGGTLQLGYKDVCKKCGAKRVDNQLGLEKTPEEYVEKIVNIFKEVKRVLKNEGTVWLNLGDTYNSGSGGYNDKYKGAFKGRKDKVDNILTTKKFISKNLKSKDLVGIPWLVAFALQKDGWYLRQDIIWHKPNPMPESVSDRCTKAHEYIFLLSKSSKYYYDYEAIKEDSVDSESKKGRRKRNIPSEEKIKSQFGKSNNWDKIEAGKTYEKRNKRSVWTVVVKSFNEAHFATFNEELIEPCILAGCPKFICKKCGKAREKIENKIQIPEYCKTYLKGEKGDKTRCGSLFGWETNSKYKKWREENPVEYILSNCGCNAGWTSGIVLDIFMGSGTTAVTTLKQNKKYIGIDLNQEYIDMAYRRIFETNLLEVEKVREICGESKTLKNITIKRKFIKKEKI